MCAGLRNQCTDMQSCTYHAYGPCGGASAPPVYLEAHIVGSALVSNAATYLTDASQLTILTPSTVSNNGYVTRDDSATSGSATYAFMTAGGFVGTNPSVSGGYVGMASYLLKSGTISTSTNSVIVPTSIGSGTVQSHNTCISPLTGGACGASRTFNQGDYKFSIYGYTTGSSYAVQSGVTHLGVRVKMSLVGAQANLIINGDKTLDTIGNADVTRLVLAMSNGKSLDMTLPNEYNVGDTTPAGLATPTATKIVKIKVSRDPNNNMAIFMDYLFEMPTQANKYFIYDPTVTESVTQNPQPGPGTANYATARKPMLFAPLAVLWAACLVTSAV